LHRTPPAGTAGFGVATRANYDRSTRANYDRSTTVAPLAPPWMARTAFIAEAFCT
jgi:hypothetical protein